MVKKITQKNKSSHHAGSARTYTARYNLARPPKDSSSVFNLGLELLDWVYDEKAQRIEQFPILKGYTPSRFFKLAETNEDFAACLEIAREVIGIRLQLLAQERKIDGQQIMKILPLYNKAYKDLQNERFLLATKATQQAPIAVYLDSIKVSDDHGR